MTDTTYVSLQTIKDFQEQSSSISAKDWLGIVALFLSAIVAVLIGQYLQDRKAKNDRIYNNKFSIFATLLGLRHAKASSESFVICINQVPIVWHQHDNILNTLKLFIEAHKDFSKSPEEQAKILNIHLNDLVLKMAIDLGYSKIDNNVMQSYYFPAASSNRYNADSTRDELYYLKNIDELLVLKGLVQPNQNNK